MFTFTVNGKSVSTDKEEKLITFLREELLLTSVKNGCSEGACGTCTILIDGKATKACVQKTSKMEGRSVVTCEGLTEREKDVYAYAFTHCGAVQCGFCTPGIIMSAVEIVGSGRTYTREELRKLISGHLCRCTGYQNILNAVERAVEECHKVAGR